ncbi:MAG TPA: hypothetical protein VMX36_01055 [Sedimentisphaerales bacterium]|nr:hypothetical protein [Sedimentisphaerales bacterium]
MSKEKIAELEKFHRWGIKGTVCSVESNLFTEFEDSLTVIVDPEQLTNNLLSKLHGLSINMLCPHQLGITRDSHCGLTSYWV